MKICNKKMTFGCLISGLVFCGILAFVPVASYAHSFEIDSIKVGNSGNDAFESSNRLLKTEIKLNSILLVGVVNPAMEFWMGNKFTLQGELLLSPYFNNCLGTGKPFACALGYVEGRYYPYTPNSLFSGFFFGPVVGGGAYKMNKGIYPLYKEQYKDDSYQQGWNMMLGLSLGYKFTLSSRWSLEIDWGGGYQHSWYRGFRRNSKDEPYYMYIDWNKDAEFLPFFKGGVLVGYRF